MVILLTCFGDLIIQFLYPPEYIDAAWILPILTLGLWPIILHQTINKFLFAIGKPQYNAFATFMKLSYMLLLLPFVLSTQGIFWGIIVIGFNDLPVYFVTLYGLWREKFFPIKQDLFFTVILLMGITSIFAIRYYVFNDVPMIFSMYYKQL